MLYKMVKMKWTVLKIHPSIFSGTPSESFSATCLFIASFARLPSFLITLFLHTSLILFTCATTASYFNLCLISVLSSEELVSTHFYTQNTCLLVHAGKVSLTFKRRRRIRMTSVKHGTSSCWTQSRWQVCFVPGLSTLWMWHTNSQCLSLLCVASFAGVKQPRVAIKVTALCDPAILVSVDGSVWHDVCACVLVSVYVTFNVHMCLCVLLGLCFRWRLQKPSLLFPNGSSQVLGLVISNWA